jgi:hypothetical protein
MTWKVLSAGLACRETPPTKKKKNQTNKTTQLCLLLDPVMRIFLLKSTNIYAWLSSQELEDVSIKLCNRHNYTWPELLAVFYR